jgi:hypothetical protein
MPDETLTAALQAVRPRVPDSLEDAAQLRAEVRAADAALGAALRAATAERLARLDRDADGGER